jgi:hypothetical protein
MQERVHEACWRRTRHGCKAPLPDLNPRVIPFDHLMDRHERAGFKGLRQ